MDLKKSSFKKKSHNAYQDHLQTSFKFHDIKQNFGKSQKYAYCQLKKFGHENFELFMTMENCYRLSRSHSLSFGFGVWFLSGCVIGNVVPCSQNWQRAPTGHAYTIL